MSSKTLLRHSMVIFLLALVLVHNTGGEQVILWAKRNVNSLSIWVASLFFLSFTGYFIAERKWLANLLAKLLGKGDGTAELERHEQGINSLFSRMLLTWALCPKCLSWWFCMFFSVFYHDYLWSYWLTGIYFGFMGGSFGVIVATSIFLLSYKSTSQ